MFTARRLLWLATPLLLGACVEGSDGDLLFIDATGTVEGLAYVDRNGDLQLQPSIDRPVSGVRVTLHPVGGSRVVADATTDSTGLYRMPLVPVGSYDLQVDAAGAGDTVRLVSVDSTRVTVAVEDTARVRIALGFPVATAAELRTLAQGRPVTLEAVVLNDPAVFGDSTAHLADTTGTIRATRVTGPRLTTGDSVRVLGRTGSRDGQPVLTDPAITILGQGTPPAPVTLSTAAAAGASGGRLDAHLVRVTDATVLNVSSLPGGDVLVVVDDGSGSLDVVIDRNARISSTEPIVSGSLVDATGLLVPLAGSSKWRLKPRSSEDVSARVPEATTAEARTLPPGRLVSLEGIALNGWSTFADSTVHVQDETGALRAVRVNQAFLFAGDRIRLWGRMGIRNGQPVLTEGTATVLGRASLPAPEVVNTATAANADGGRLDAAQVRVPRALVVDTASVGNDFVLGVDDGSGLLLVLLDRDTGINPRGYAIGSRYDITGLLVPVAAADTWVLKPRNPADLVAASP